MNPEVISAWMTGSLQFAAKKDWLRELRRQPGEPTVQAAKDVLGVSLGVRERDSLLVAVGGAGLARWLAEPAQGADLTKRKNKPVSMDAVFCYWAGLPK